MDELYKICTFKKKLLSNADDTDNIWIGFI